MDKKYLSNLVDKIADESIEDNLKHRTHYFLMCKIDKYIKSRPKLKKFLGLCTGKEYAKGVERIVSKEVFSDPDSASADAKAASEALDSDYLFATYHDYGFTADPIFDQMSEPDDIIQRIEDAIDKNIR